MRAVTALVVGTGLLLPAHGLISSPVSATPARTYAGHWHAWPSFKDSTAYGKISPAGAAAADYDGDGKFDLAAESATGAWVVDLAANGLDGVDQVYANGYPVGVSVPADYDGDGKADIAVWSGGSLSVDGSADGFHGIDAVHPEGPADGRPLAGDFDGDGRPDIAVLGTDGVLSVDLAANGLGTVDQTVSYGGPVDGSVAGGDLDGDGKADLAVLASDGTLRVDGSADGLGSLGSSIGGYPSAGSLALADNDGDGRADINVLDTADGLWVVDSSADGLSPLASSTVRLDGFNFPGAAMAPVDVDGDGKADITVLTAARRWLAELSSDPAAPLPVFTAKSTMLDNVGGAVAPGDGAAADYDGDGKADLAARTATGSWVIDLAANGISGPDQVVANGYPAGTPVPADFDGDGKADIAVWSDGSLAVDGSADGYHGIDAVHPEGPADGRPLVADFDGDGKPDLAVLGTDGVLSIDLTANGLGGVDQTAAYGAPLSGSLAAGDLDGDGKADLAVLGADGTLRVDLSADGLGALGPSISGYPAGASLAIADRAVQVLDGANGVWLVDPAGDGLDPAASSTSRTTGFPAGQLAAVDTEGDGHADATVLTRFAYPAAYGGDLATAPQARWLVRGTTGPRRGLVGYWQGEGYLSQILDDKAVDPSIGDFNMVHMAWGVSSYESGSDSYTGSFLRDRVDKAKAQGSQVILDLTYLFLEHPDQLSALRADLCPTPAQCRYLWLEPMDEPYGHGETPELFTQQVNGLRAMFPEAQFKIVMVEGTGTAASPDQPCPNPSGQAVYFWCWYKVDPQNAIPAGVDILAFDVFAYGEFVKAYNDLRTITSKPLIGWVPSAWFCSPTCNSFPVPKPQQIVAGDSAPPEDTLPFAQFGLDDPQILGDAIFIYGRDPDRGLPGTDPYGPNGLPGPQRQTYMRVQRSMMWARSVVPSPTPPPGLPGPYPGTYHGTVAVPNPAGSVVLNRFLSNGCRPDPTVQGTDGYVVDLGSVTSVDVAGTAVATAGYDGFLYDDRCHQVAYGVADPTAAVHLDAPSGGTARWLVVHLGLGAALQFTATAR
jgi:hypothetical protein